MVVPLGSGVNEKMAARDALMDIDFSFEWINEFSRNTHYDNGSIKAKKVMKSTVDWYDRQTDNVIAIDFGTSTLAVAYQLNGGDVYDLPIQEDRKCIPTVLLMKKNGTYEIGEKALCQYGRLEVDIATSVFFEKVKLELQHDRVSHTIVFIHGIASKRACVMTSFAFRMPVVEGGANVCLGLKGGGQTHN